MEKDQSYYNGYLTGYWDGVKDASSGKTSDWQKTGIGKLPVKAMAISTRAHKCLLNSGCTNVEDVIALSDDTIRKMRNMGKKTASEIAHWLIEHGIPGSPWSEYF